MKRVVRSRRGRIGLAVSGIVVIGVMAAASYYLFGLGGGAGAKATKATTAAPTLAATKDGVVFTIDPSASDATFTIDEILFGRPNTVVGKTNQVAGQILINTTDPAKSQIGQIRVDVSTLVTDNDFRNRALQNRILETSDPANQFAVFVAKTLTGLPTTTAGRAFGDSVTFQATGSLTVHQVTRTVTFAITVTVESATLIKGHAQTTVRYQDFNLTMPSVPSVTGVSDNVTLALDFTAKA